ncbi:E3 ubiquitin-protein ligase ZNF598 [Lycorma delicatula]|uniref:E3 ubiquitin-protein ligase ZNF598 n=1 Tax=Lycorma delicatula TaxID=130591 RepID=UPI003F51903C
MSSVTAEENCENTCVVCFKNIEIFSIGVCDHPFCYECSTRMRVLCRQTECPICRQDMPKVIFTKHIQPFKDIKNGSYFSDRKFRIDFENAKIRQAYDSLLAHVCLKCPEKIAFQNFLLLKEHMRRSHELFYCELCVDNLKILTCERRCYTRSELEQHRRKGDPDDKSHKGHPLCKFCDKRYMDKDELCRHLRRDHLFCHFCDADGYNQYYSSYDTLRDHFRSEHYLCEEGGCYDEKFTSVFRTDIDLKAHRASVHGRTIGKAATKQARTLELAFRLAPRPGLEYRHGRGPRNSRHVFDEWEEQGAVGGAYDDEQNYYNSGRSSGFSSINTDCIDEFPTLGGSSMNSQMSASRKPTSNVTIRAAVQGGRELAITDENFPALGPEATVSLRVNSSTSERPKSTGAVTKSQPTNFSIHVNHRPNSLMTRVTSSGGGGHSSNSNNTNNNNNNNSNNFRSKEDFPALCNTKMLQPGFQLASSQWSSGREPDSKVSIIKNKNSQPQLLQQQKNKQNFSIEKDNFPQLSSRFEAGCSVRTETKHQPTSSPHYAPETKVKKATSLTVPLNDSWVPLSRDQSNNGSISGDSEVGNKTGSKKKKKKSGGKNSANSLSNSSGNDVKNVQKNLDNDISKTNLDSDSKKKKQKHVNASNSHPLSNSNKNQKYANPSGLSLASSSNGYERKRSELKIGKLVSQSEEKLNTDNCNNNNGNENTINVNNINNNNEISSKISSKPPGFLEIPREKPPPGFETTSKTTPPPGFSIKLNSIARPPNSSNGLTFTNSSGQSYPITPGSNNLTPTTHTYVPPVNFAPRNGELVESVMSALKDCSKLDEFRNMSLEFRQNVLSAKDYYNHCQQAMGSDFDDIFPELIVLLPDIEKQQELWNVHQMLSKPTTSKNISKKSRLDVCTICRQVLNATDVAQHQTTHVLENDFPLLTNGLSNQSWTKK